MLNLHKVDLLFIKSAFVLSLSFTLAYASPSEPPSIVKNDFLHSESQILKQSGLAKTGSEMPFFSGWTISNGLGQAYSRTKALKDHHDRYVVNICASWCKPCMIGLEVLSKEKRKFNETNTELIILVADKSQNGREIFDRFSFDWAQVIVDEFQTFALKLAPNVKSNEGGESLSLPRTIIFDKQGVITKIIGREGQDYINQIFEP